PHHRGAGGRPRLRNVAGAPAPERHASTLELFFDMVFVVAVAELADLLVHHPSPAGLAHYVALFVPVWWAWVGYTFYADRFDGDDLTHRGTMIAAMLAVVALAATIPDAFSEHGSIRFVLSYLAVRVLLILLYIRAHRHVPEARPLTGRYLVVFASGAGLWLASLLVEPPDRFWLWGAGMLVELLPPLVFTRVITSLPFHLSHIPERFGLFTIIVLGESVALGALGIAGHDPTPLAGVVWTGGLLIAAAQWWLYFDCLDHRPLRRWRLTGQAYLYGHLLIFAGITASGAATLLALESGVDAGPLDAATLWMLCGGIAAFLLGAGFIHYVATAPRGDPQAWTRLGLGAAVLAFAALLPGLPVIAVEAVLLAGLVAQVAFELTLLSRRFGGDVAAAAT
ncbi:MAG: low temperature requirement protein A, partial [Pseudonocardia sp.]